MNRTLLYFHFQISKLAYFQISAQYSLYFYVYYKLTNHILYQNAKPESISGFLFSCIFERNTVHGTIHYHTGLIISSYIFTNARLYQPLSRTCQLNQKSP